MKKREAFTLVELLVVIAVIALLMSILMPALQRVRKMAKATICRSNVKQWGLIFHLYAHDNENKLPQSVGGGSLNSQDAYWIRATLPYYGEKDIRLCPSTKLIRSQPKDRSHGSPLGCWGPLPPATPSDWWADFDTGSYGLNEWCATPPPNRTTYWGFPTKDAWKTVDAKGANRVPLFMDCIYVDAYPEDDNTPLPNEPPPYKEWVNSDGDWGYEAMRLVCLDRHNGGINIVFLDSSVAKVPLRALWRLKWHRSFDIDGLVYKRAYNWPQWMMKYRDEY